MTNQPTWTDETEAKYKTWHKDRYGVEPPQVKEKEVKMPAGDFPEQGQLPPKKAMNDKIEYFMGNLVEQPLLGEHPAIEPPAPSKRTRRHKGVEPGITVETLNTAFVEVSIPNRPKGMDKVFIRIWKPGELEKGGLIIEWPEGKMALQAISEYFNPTGTMKIPGATDAT